MAYTDNEKSTGLDTLDDTTLAQGDLHILGDVSDSGRAKTITENLLEDYIANSTNFINELTANATFITNINTIAPSPLTTKGDLYTYTSVPARLAVGTNGQVLSANSVQATGLEWIDLSTSGGGGTKLAIDTTAFSHTGDTTETTMFTVVIPGGTLSTNNAIRFYVLGSADGNTGNITFRTKYGASTVASVVDASGTSADYIYSGVIIADASAAAQVSSNQLVKGGNVATASDGTDSTENSAGDLNLVVTMQLADAGGTVTAKGIIVEKISSTVDLPTTVVYTSNDTWTKSNYPGLKYVVVEVVGGGGGGGGSSVDDMAGAGGGGGGYSKKTIAVGTLGATETVTIGAAGTAGTGGGGTGGNGGTSSFGAHASATGGTGGAGSTNPTAGSSLGGIGSSGDLNIRGGGGSPIAFANSGGGSQTGSGSGGSSFYGGGAPGVFDDVNPIAGVAGGVYGGGGSGGMSANAADAAGGAGGAGVIVVTHVF